VQKIAEGLESELFYIYEFNEELVICTRRLADSTASGEPSLPLTVPDDGDDSDMVQATWMTDPLVHEVPGLTVKRLKLLVNRCGSYCGELWSSTHTVTKHKIHLQQRVDRHLLVSLYEQTRQILQLRLDLLGPIEDQRQQLPKESEVLKKGISIMQPIGEKYCRGDLTKDDLKQARDTAIKESGFTLCKKAAMKKPASCEKPSTKKKAVKKEPCTEKPDVTEKEPTTEEEPDVTEKDMDVPSETDKQLTSEPSKKKGPQAAIMKKPAGMQPAPVATSSTEEEPDVTEKDTDVPEETDKQPTSEPSKKKGAKAAIMKKPAGVHPDRVATSSSSTSSSSTAPAYESLPPPPASFFFSDWLADN
jgi:hypothetical protein